MNTDFENISKCVFLLIIQNFTLIITKNVRLFINCECLKTRKIRSIKCHIIFTVTKINDRTYIIYYILYNQDDIQQNTTNQ